jgi:ribosomal protein L30E
MDKGKIKSQNRILSGKESRAMICALNIKNNRKSKVEIIKEVKTLPATRFAASSSFLGSITVLSYFNVAKE